MSAIATAVRRTSCHRLHWTHSDGLEHQIRFQFAWRRTFQTTPQLMVSSQVSSHAVAPVMENGVSGLVRKQQVVVISGPTAVGKSALALELAQRLGGEIISCDSVQVYRGLDIGSAKTLESDRRGIPHHLLDIKEPNEEYTAGDFYKDARAATDDVLARGKLPIVVGGTGLYLRWFIHGTPDTPKATPELVAEVESKIADLQRRPNGWPDAVAYLAEAGDPQTAAALAPNDWYRMRRAIEIVLASGKAKSEFQLNFVKAPRNAPVRRPKRRSTASSRRPGAPDYHLAEGIPGQSRDRPPSNCTSEAASVLEPNPAQTLEAPLIDSAQNSDAMSAQASNPSSPDASHSAELPAFNQTVLDTAAQASEDTASQNTEQNAHTNPDQSLERNPETPSTSGRDLDYDFRCYFLFGPRRELYRKIDERCEQMLAGGLLEEASALLDASIRPDTCMPSRAIGYRQALEYLEECRAGGVGIPEGKKRFVQLLEEIQQASRRYAKRQLTWFRSEGSFLWLDASQPTAELANRISTELALNSSALDSQKGLIPDSWLSREQEKELKAYRSERKIFADDGPIERVLTWVERTQRSGRGNGVVSGPPDTQIEALVGSRKRLS